jgi:hypothetical protein
MPLLALGHKMALSLLTLMLGGALSLATKPRATKRDATDMIRSLGIGFERNAEPQPVDSAAVKLIKRGPEYSILKNRRVKLLLPLLESPALCVMLTQLSGMDTKT